VTAAGRGRPACIGTDAYPFGWNGTFFHWIPLFQWEMYYTHCMPESCEQSGCEIQKSKKKKKLGRDRTVYVRSTSYYGRSMYVMGKWQSGCYVYLSARARGPHAVSVRLSLGWGAGSYSYVIPLQTPNDRQSLRPQLFPQSIIVVLGVPSHPSKFTFTTFPKQPSPHSCTARSLPSRRRAGSHLCTAPHRTVNALLCNCIA
jgi:hypothetical protein